MSGKDGANMARIIRLHTPEADEGLIRASDHDRELATRVLRDAYAEGRLEINEFLKRVDAAQQAKTWGELAALTADLPVDWAPSLEAPGTRRCDGLAEMRREPRHPFAPIWWVAVAWLVIAAVAHVAAAIPLVLLSLFVLGLACRNKPVPDSRTRRSRVSERAAGSARRPGRS
jgi:hypothetical protein